MNRIIALISTIICLLLLCGCSSLELNSVDSLMRPPKQTGENAQIEAAFESDVGDSYTLTAPLNGLYKTSYIVYDINGDGLDEAIVFYTSSNAGVVHLNVIGHSGSEWFSACDIDGAGTKVERVEFSDLDGDGISEIIVGWSLYEGLTSQFMCVYRCKNPDSMVMSQISNMPYASFEPIDIDNNGVCDLLLLGSLVDDEGDRKQYASFVSLRDGKLSVVGEATLDSAVSSYISVQTDVNMTGSNRRIYIDVTCDDGSWLTQCLAWNSEKLVFDSPLSDDISGNVDITRRNVMILSSDIDDDGYIEMPSADIMEGSSTIKDNKTLEDVNLTVITWLRVLGGSTVEAGRCAYNPDDGYMLTLMPEWGDVTAVSDRDNCTLKIYPYERGTSLSKAAKELFTIKAVSPGQQSAYESYYSTLLTDGDLCLMYKISSQGEQLGITKQQLYKLITAI